MDSVSALPDKWIRISLSEDQNQVKIAISNNGLAITPQVREKLFQPFFTSKEIGKGTGLGLSIAMGIILSHEGELRLNDSSENTCFEIILPKPAAETA